MELRSLKYFVVIAEELNITAAAERLNMSQPPLSHQLQMLEEELGALLFIRGKRRLTLTDEGSVLLRRARELLELEDRTKSEINEMKNGISGTLYIGTVEGSAPYLAAEHIAGFREEFPNVRYNLWNGSSDDVTERLLKGLVDVAVIALPYDSEKLDGIELESEPWTAFIPENHPLAAEKGEISIKMLDGEPLVVPARKSRMNSIRTWFAECGAEPDFLCATSNYLDAMALTEQGVGISIFPETGHSRNRGVVSRGISGHSIRYVLVWRKDCRLSETAEAFVDFIRDTQE